jgi:hypothetical protein
MKQLSLILVLATLLSCKDDALSDSYILFTEPQPANVDAISSFPENYWGTYGKNSDRIKIDFQHMITINVNFYDRPKSEIDSVPGFEFKNNKVYDKFTNEACKTSINQNNIVHWEVATMDTVFSFSKNQIAKSYKSSLILNKKVDDNYQVSIIKMDSNNPQYIQLGTKEDFQKLQTELKIPFKTIDSTRALLSPSRADFRKLLRLNGFEYQKNFN